MEGDTTQITNQQQKDIDIESKDAIKEVFLKFDKDGSGQIDYNEIKAISKELGVEVNEAEAIKIFKDLDVNGDGQIDFEEFWQWWSKGRPNKLEKLVYFKLKSMKLLKKAHSNFTRIGGSLDNKYNDELDSHYAAINYGSSTGNMRLNLTVYSEHPDGQSQIQKICDINGIDSAQNPTFLAFKLKSIEGKQEELVKMLEKAIEEIKEFLSNAVPPEMVAVIETIEFKITPQDNNQVYITVQFDNTLISSIEENEQVKIGKQFTKQAQTHFTASLGLKNSLQTIISEPDKKFVKTFLEGFLFESKLVMNKGFLKNLRNMLSRKLEKLNNKDEKSKKSQNLPILSLLSLIHASKFHVVFKDIGDIEEFFQGLGLSELADEQPSNKELLDEVAEELYYMGPVDILNSEELPFKNILQELTDLSEAQFQIIMIHQNNYINLDIVAPGIGKIYQQIQKKVSEENL